VAVTDDVRTRPKNRRELILAAASARFHRQGYARTSLDDIAGDLGVTAPALYRHFRGKDDLYTAALELNLRQLETCIAEATSADHVVRSLAEVAVAYPTLGLLWNTDRRRRLVDPDGTLERRLETVADDLGVLFEGAASPDLARLLARGALAASSSTGFYEAALSPAAQAEQLERAIASVAAFRPAHPLVALQVAPERAVTRPWATRRSALLDAGAVLVVQRGGYQAVTIEEIATTAGVSPNTVYLHFTGKADLFVAVLRRAASWLTAAVQQASAQATSAEEALRLAIASSLALSAQHPSWTSSLADEMSNLPADQIADLELSVEEYLDEWLALCVAVVPSLTVEETRVRMRAALAVLDDRALEAADRSVFSTEDSADLVIDILRSE
jgi:AcrR family transcriptional regulator